VAVLSRGAARWAATTDEHALSWAKAVLRNFVISQGVRWRARRMEVHGALAPLLAPDNDQCRTVVELLDLLRQELCWVVRARDRASMLRAFEVDAKSESYEDGVNPNNASLLTTVVVEVALLPTGTVGITAVGRDIGRFGSDR
jgi:hypothetical protein